MTPRRSIQWLMGTWVAISLAACGDSAGTSNSEGSAGVVSDSLGVRVVQHELPALDDTSAAYALLSTAPTLRIDSVPRASQSELHQVTGAAITDRGQLVVGHGSVKELLVFDSTASSMHVVGRLGSGPSEFRSLSAPWPVQGGRMAAYDGSLRRFSFFNADGTLQREQPVRREALPDSSTMVWQAFGVTTTGTALLWVDGPLPESGGLSRPQMYVVAMDSTGTTATVGGDRPGLERYAMPPRNDGFISMGLSPFAPSPLATPCGDKVAIADNMSYAVSVLALDGNTELIVRADVERREASDEDFRTALRSRSGMENVNEGEIPIMRMMTPTGLLPVLKSVHCDAAYNIWLEEWPHADGAMTRLSSFTSDGARRFSLLLTADMRLLAVQPDAVVLAVRDENGVEHVEVRSVEIGV